MEFFRNCHTLDALKAEYRRLVKIHHPDIGGDVETMKAVNAQYDEAVKHIQRNPGHTDYQRAQRERPEAWRAVVEALMHVPGIVIELCGSWIWVTGDTYAHRAQIKAIGCIWSARKNAWYWHAPDEVCNSHKRMTLDEIRAYHGSRVLAETEPAPEVDKLESAG